MLPVFQYQQPHLCPAAFLILLSGSMEKTTHKDVRVGANQTLTQIQKHSISSIDLYWTMWALFTSVTSHMYIAADAQSVKSVMRWLPSGVFCSVSVLLWGQREGEKVLDGANREGSTQMVLTALVEDARFSISSWVTHTFPEDCSEDENTPKSTQTYKNVHTRGNKKHSRTHLCSYFHIYPPTHTYIHAHKDKHCVEWCQGRKCISGR